MGSGNIMFNLECEAKEIIGLDVIKLLPKIYDYIQNNHFQITYQNVMDIINQYDNFYPKEHYYSFRDKWNEQYVSDNISKNFIIETLLLLKMCSNSMIRFNNKTGKFNQGYRGCSEKGFFTDVKIWNLTKKFNDVINQIENNKAKYKFYNYDFFDYIKKLQLTEEDLLILDPPYLLADGLYSGNFTPAKDQELTNLLLSTKANFIYFNFLKKFEQENDNVKPLLKYYLINLRNETTTGQWRKGNATVEEILITNLVPSVNY